jgi:hypothetical protein
MYTRANDKTAMGASGEGKLNISSNPPPPPTPNWIKKDDQNVRREVNIPNINNTVTFLVWP